MYTQEIQNVIGLSLVAVGLLIFVALTQILEVIQ